MGHLFILTITIHISYILTVGCLINGYGLMDILSVVGTLVYNHGGDKMLSIRTSEDE